MNRLLVVQVAALGRDFAAKGGFDRLGAMTLRSAPSAFPALTCTASASFRTGEGPESHGMLANGFLDRALREPCFWKQHAGLVKGRRFWDGLRERGGTVAVGFIQQSLGERADAVTSPAPIHRHGGGMIMDCRSDPPEFHARLRAANRSDFALWRYWGPFASVKSSRWIARGFASYLSAPEACDLVWCYLPGLDYDLQREGPDSPAAARALAATREDLELLVEAAAANGYRALVFGDYAIEPVTAGVAFPNRRLREAGLFRVREVAGMEYPDLFLSGAFAVCDHQTATLEVFDPALRERAIATLEADPLVERVEERAGSLLATAVPGAWFSYRWWTDDRRAPDYAHHVDIHNKPGYDPCELFADGLNPFRTSTDETRVKGTHGRASTVAVFTDVVDRPFGSFAELSDAAEEWLTGETGRRRG